MEPVVLAFASNERYFPGLYCAVASALNHVSWKTSVNLWVLDGGISQASKDRLERLGERFCNQVSLKFVPVDESVFWGATLGPRETPMTFLPVFSATLPNWPPVVYL